MEETKERDMPAGERGVRKVPVKGKRKDIQRTGPIKAAGDNSGAKEAEQKNTAPFQMVEARGPLPEVDTRETTREPPDDQDGEIFVIIEDSADIDGGANHWALFFQPPNTSTGVISEAVSISGQHVYRPRFNIKPESGSRFARKIPIAWTASYEKYIMTLRFTPIRNDVEGWNCQNFVAEGIQGLCEDWWIEVGELRRAIGVLRPLMDSRAVGYDTPESD